MVEQHQVLDAGCHRQLQRLVQDAVAPAVLGRHVSRQILGIVDQHVRPLAELHVTGERNGLDVAGRLQLVVGQIHDGAPVVGNAVAKTSARMVEGDDISMQTQIGEYRTGIVKDHPAIGKKRVKLDGKTGAVHLLNQGAGDGLTQCWQKTMNPATLVEGLEGRETLDVVPMVMCDHDIDFTGCRRQTLAEVTNPCARIQHKGDFIAEMDTDASRVASIANGRRARRGKCPPYTPKADGEWSMHQYRSFQQTYCRQACGAFAADATWAE